MTEHGGRRLVLCYMACASQFDIPEIVSVWGKKGMDMHYLVVAGRCI